MWLPQCPGSTEVHSRPQRSACLPTTGRAQEAPAPFAMRKQSGDIPSCSSAADLAGPSPVSAELCVQAVAQRGGRQSSKNKRGWHGRVISNGPPIAIATCPQSGIDVIMSGVHWGLPTPCSARPIQGLAASGSSCGALGARGGLRPEALRRLRMWCLCKYCSTTNALAPPWPLGFLHDTSPL